MTQPLSSNEVLCRPAVEGDRKDVFEFCKGIWEGDDYVPDVWDDWIQDPTGLLAVAELDGHAIGCSKITCISPGQWWLEGFRVDPQYQEMKVGSHLHKYAVDWWLKRGGGLIRLMTDGQNYPVHHLCEKTGFRKTGEVCGYRAAALAETVDHFTAAANLQAAAAFAIESESIQTTNGLSDFGWRICKPVEEVIKNFSSENADYLHHFYWWNERQGLFSIWEDEEEERRTLVLGVIACSLRDMPALLLDVRRFASMAKFDSIFQIAFDIPQIISPLLAAGFEKRWKRSNAFIFEKAYPG
jgi:GNAT superfamily N-acetyltransferase